MARAFDRLGAIGAIDACGGKFKSAGRWVHSYDIRFLFFSLFLPSFFLGVQLEKAKTSLAPSKEDTPRFSLGFRRISFWLPISSELHLR